jgi:phosphatidyl-N-methylethanolamine N-methyltransferase
VSFALLIAAPLLALERACYVWIARAPRSFCRWCARPAVARLGDPITVVRLLFGAFKVLQGAVFAGWCLAYGDFPTVSESGAAVAMGTALIVVGQTLSVIVFYRLGRVAVFFGDRLGYDVAWCEAFPFSVLAHPQYVGSVLTIWGFFLAVRFPHDDWFVLPLLETVYYAIGAFLENRTVHAVTDDADGTTRVVHAMRTQP